jgi:lysophospholipase L1-like esterase
MRLTHNNWRFAFAAISLLVSSSQIEVLAQTFEFARPRCMIIGDSIAQGVGTYAPQCRLVAAKGITTKDWLNRFGKSVENVAIAFDLVLISLGTNDGDIVDVQSLKQTRRSVDRAGRVVWIAPAPKFAIRSEILTLAKEYGDVVYERPIEQLQSDGIHFSGAGYRRIASVMDSLI